MLACTGCRAPIAIPLSGSPTSVVCGSCSASLTIETFPALFRPSSAAAHGEAVVTGGEASCYYHSRKRAVVPCDACGRFLCSLCDIEIRGEHLCPGCLEAGREGGRLLHLEHRRTLYDRIALALAVYPMLLFYFTLFTAPVVLFLSFRYWKAPGSILPHTKIRFLLAMMLATLQIAGWIALAGFFVDTLRRTPR